MEKDSYYDWGKNYVSEKVVSEKKGSNNPPISINKKNPLNRALIIAGCKYIAENQSLDFEELREGLINLGCVFSIEDVLRKYPSSNPIGDGLRMGDLACAAVVILNSRDSEYTRADCQQRYLDNDDETSLYHFIRRATRDKTYTKEYVDSLKRHK